MLRKVKNTNVRCTGSPGHSCNKQSSSSVEFPGHCSFPAEAGSLHVRALNLDPGPQDAEQEDHWPHSIHSATGAAIVDIMRLFGFSQNINNN